MKNKTKKAVRLMFLLAGLTYVISGCGFLEKAESLKNELAKTVMEPDQPKDPVKKKTVKKETEEQAPVADTETEIPSETDTEEETEQKGEFLGREEDLAYAENYAYQTLSDTEKEVYHEMLTAILEHEEEIEVSTLEVEL